MTLLTGSECRERYELLRELGAGAMGSVHLARDRQLGRKVALKFLHGRSWSDEALDRFFEEAAALARLRHPNVVQVLDHGDRYEVPYIAFEYVEGDSLLAAIRRAGPLPFDRVRDWALQLCGGMAHAHDEGILHRDLKSENVMVDGEGRLRITDFGLARRDDRRQELTATGTIMGTPGYISPEQAKGAKALPASDQYSLAIIVYEMLCARLPFRRDSVAELLMDHLRSAPPPPTHVRPDCPPALSRVLLRALAKDPGERWPSMAAFGEALAGAFDDADAPPSAAGRTLRSSDASVLPGATARVAAAREEGTPRESSPGGRTRVLAPGGEPSVDRRRGLRFVGGMVFLVVAIPALFLLRSGPDETVAKSLSIEVGTHSARVRWRSAEARRFEWRVESAGRRLVGGREAAATREHVVDIGRLQPDSPLRFVLDDGRTRSTRTFRTDEVRLRRGVWTWAWNGSLLVDFDSNCEDRLDLSVVDPKGRERRERIDGAGPKRVVVSGMDRSPKRVYAWTLLAQGRVLARGATPTQPEGIVFPGRAWDRYSRELVPARVEGTVVTRGDDVYACDNAGLVTCFRRLRSDGSESPAAPGFALRPIWVFEAPGQPSMDRRQNRRAAGQTVLPDGRLLFAVHLEDRDLVRFFCLDPAERARRWREGTGGKDPAALLAETPRRWPPGWEGELGPTEWTLTTTHRGWPLAGNLVREGRVYVVAGSRTSAERPFPLHLLEVDPGARRVRTLGGWPEEAARRHATWRVHTRPRMLGDHVLFTVRHPDQEVVDLYSMHEVLLVALPLDGSPGRTCFAFRSRSTENPIAVDERARTVRVCSHEGILEWTLGDWGRKPRLIPLPEEVATPPRYLTGCPIRDGDTDFLLLFRSEGIQGRVLEFTQFRCELNLRLLKRREGRFLVYDPPLGTSYANRQLASVSHWERWKDVAIFDCGDLVLMLDLKTGRFQTSAHSGIESLHVSEDGIVWVSSSSGRLLCMPVELYMQSSDRRVARTAAAP